MTSRRLSRVVQDVGILILALLAVAPRHGVWAASPAATKSRLLVDKVLMASTGRTMTADHMATIASAGFTAVSPRWGNQTEAEVRRTATLAAAAGLQYLPWMRGTVPADTAAQEHRLVWASGSVQELLSPNVPELWERLGAQVAMYARVSADEPALAGVCFDFENYAPGAEGDAYGLSYDGYVLQEFAASRGLALPMLAPADRHGWLVAQDLQQEFVGFQTDLWRQYCGALRRAVDAIAPGFRFWVHPAPGTLFIQEAVIPEWGTAQAPLILADAVTFGRPYGMFAHAEALHLNAERLSRRQAYARQAGVPLHYVGGVTPLRPGADPEFCAKSAVRIAGASDGYWVFYDGPEYGSQEHQDYWRWFTWANQAIAAGRLEAYREPRVTPDVLAVEGLERRTERPQIGLFGLKPRMVELIQSAGHFEVHELGGISPEYLSQLDVVLLQNFNLELDAAHPWVRALRAYVRQGGGLMLAHDTAWFMDSPVPEVAVRAYPLRRVEAVRHVVDRLLVVEVPHPATGGLESGVEFETEFRDHMIFTPGELGTVVVRNRFGDPVYVVGEFGAGRIVFSGSYYGYERPLEQPERGVLLSCLRWLAQ